MPNLERWDLEIKGDPVPKAKGSGNIKATGTGFEEDRGRELPARRPEWYERSDPRGIMNSLRQAPWQPPKDALGSGRGMTEQELATLHRKDPEHYADPKSYNTGGMVKHGSATRISCKGKHHG